MRAEGPPACAQRRGNTEPTLTRHRGLKFPQRATDFLGFMASCVSKNFRGPSVDAVCGTGCIRDAAEAGAAAGAVGLNVTESLRACEMS